VTARVVLHIPARMIAALETDRPPLLYSRIRDVVQAQGGTVEVVEGFQSSRYREDGHLHIVENGHWQKPGVLNAATAYFEGFFHVDPIGIQAASSIGKLPYDPEAVDGNAARAYLAGLQARFSKARHSRYRQMRQRSDLPQGAIAVFLQGPAPQRSGQAFCSYEVMLEAVCQGAEGRPVLVKPHPLQTEYGQQTIADVRARGFSPIETAANVHDILAAAAVTVSVNSAAGLEGFLHAKPAIFFGASDCHAFVETARSPADFPTALAAALASHCDYARALYWYFGLNCLDVTADSFAPRLLAIFARAGFNARRLGLNG
jgi:hypothetical protein